MVKTMFIKMHNNVIDFNLEIISLQSVSPRKTTVLKQGVPLSGKSSHIEDSSRQFCEYRLEVPYSGE